MTLYLGSTHPDYRDRAIGAHRKLSRWDQFLDRVCPVYPRKESR